MRLKDVLKYQPKPDRINRDRDSTRRRKNSKIDRQKQHRAKSTKRRTENQASKQTKKAAAVIRPGASIATTARSRSRNNHNNNNDKTIDLSNEDDADRDEESSDEDEIPYKMNFSQQAGSKPNRKQSPDGESDSSSDDDDGYESPLYNSQLDGDIATCKLQKRGPREPLRPGDVIEYDDTAIFAAGSGRGRHTATVLGTTPGARFPLHLSTGDFLQDSVRICRTHEFHKDDDRLYRHAGYWKPISDFRLRKRSLRNPDGSPIAAQGGILGQAKAFRELRDNLHTKAVEYLRGEHDDKITAKKNDKREANHSGASNATNDRSSKTITSTAVSNNPPKQKDKRGDDDNASESSSSSDDSELRAEVERQREERKRRSEKRENKPHGKCIRTRTPPNQKNAYIDIDDASMSSSSSSEDSEVQLEFKKLKEKQIQRANKPQNHKAVKNCNLPNRKASCDDNDDDKASKASSCSEDTELRLEFQRLKDKRKKHEKKSRNNNISSIRKSPPLLLSEDDGSDMVGASDNKNRTPRAGLVLKKFSTATCRRNANHLDGHDGTKDELRRVHALDQRRGKDQQSKTPKSIEIHIDIDPKTKPQSPSKMRRSDDCSLSSSSSSSMASTAKRKERRPPITKKRRALSTRLTTVVSKVGDAMRDEEWLNDSESDEESLLLGDPIFSKNNNMQQQPRNRNRSPNEIPSKRQLASPMEENPVDLFEDSSGDEDSSGGSTFRKRNRRGERMLRSPSVDLHHKHRATTSSSDGQVTWLTQEQHGGAEEKHATSTVRSSSPSRRNVKRSVVVGYRPLVFSVDGKQSHIDVQSGDRQQEDSSPPSLAKAYRKREAARQQQQQRERNAKVTLEDREINQKRRDTHRRKSPEREDSNRRKLQREKQKLRKQRARPPPYPRPRSDPHLADFSTQENEWTDDCEQDDYKSCRNNQYGGRGKRRPNHERGQTRATPAASAASSSSSDSEPTPRKRCRISNQKQKSTSNWNSSLDSVDDEEEEPKRKRLTPKSRRQNHVPRPDSKSRVQKSHENRRYELSPSSSGGSPQKTPRTPWSTDCEVDSPLPSAVVVSSGARRNPTTKDSARASRTGSSTKSKCTKGRPSVFDFLSQDENEKQGSIAKRHISPKSMSSSKRKASKTKSGR